MANTILPKHLIGVVDRSVPSTKRLPRELSQRLLELGRNDPDKVLTALGTSLDGLSGADVKRRLQEYGLNEVAHQKPPAWWMQLLRALFTPFTLILFALGITSFFTDVLLAGPGNADWTKVIILSTMVALSTFIRFWQEFRSQKEAEKLRALVQNKAVVTRVWQDGQHRDTVPTQTGEQREVVLSEVVPGDIITLASGDMVPADLRLLSSKDLFVSQSALTGESMPVEKYAKLSEVSDEAEREEEARTSDPLELGTLCFMGTNIVSGSAVGVVIATGNQTYFGSMAADVTDQRPMTSFDKGVNKVSWLLIRFVLIMVPIVFILNGFTKHNWHDALFFALAVAVGLTPEMLPMIVTTNLAKGSVKMAKKNVIVKKLNAIQNFGAMDVLCTDKTGTLTENRVVLMRYLDADGKEDHHVLNLAYINSFFQTGLHNLMDEAVIQKKEELGSVDEQTTYRKIDEIPFDFERRRMSVIVQDKDGKDMLVCKGAVEEVLRLCTKVEEDGKVVSVKKHELNEVHSLTQGMNGEGLRVLAIAYKPVGDNKHFYKVADESDLILAGYIGFLDPPKASAKDAIALLSHHGIAIKLITGDNEIVTKRICEEVGLESNTVLLGKDIDALSDSDLAARVEGTNIFAKIDPLQKARIIEALRSGGHTVGYMGDGINDAAAMHEADVSVSVDTAVDIAKEAADIILLKSDLLVLDQGVVEGRMVFGNIMKYIKMTASSNFGNVFSVLVASALLPFLPMAALQILVLNLLYDISQISLPWDTMDEEFLRKPRRWEASSIGRFMLFIGPTSSVFDLTTFALLWFGYGANAVSHAPLFQAGWFVESLMTQTLVVHMLRTQKIPFIQSRAAAPVLLLTSMIITLGAIIPFTGFGHSLGMQALPLSYFVWLVMTVAAYGALVQIVKSWYIRRFKVWL